jgi:hypothetical protein
MTNEQEHVCCAEVKDVSVLSVLPESQKSDIVESLKMIASEVLSICAEVCDMKPACVPARTALFKQYVHMAHAGKVREEDKGVKYAQAGEIEDALKKLKAALVQMDPIHSNWYEHVVHELYGYAEGHSSDAEPSASAPTRSEPSGAGPDESNPGGNGDAFGK